MLQAMIPGADQLASELPDPVAQTRAKLGLQDLTPVVQQAQAQGFAASQAAPTTFNVGGENPGHAIADQRALQSGIAPGSLHGSNGIVRLASSQIGTPYVWGASNPSGPRGGPGGAFDCSGLTQWVYSRLGVDLPHNAQAQSQMVQHLSFQQLRPGDLLFFGSPGSIHHVAIYAGGHRMIDAPHTGASVRTERIWGDFAFGGRVR